MLQVRWMTVLHAATRMTEQRGGQPAAPVWLLRGTRNQAQTLQRWHLENVCCVN